MPHQVRHECVLDDVFVSLVKVRTIVSHSNKAEGNCVIVRWGGEQPEAKEQPVGDEPDSAG
jgi:hypothetical protein